MSDEAPDRPPIQNDLKETISQKRTALVWYGVGTALIALYLGAAAGLSSSPVIGILLPLLFSILGGVGGLYIAKTNLEDSALSHRTKRVGVFITLFAISLMVGSIYGISIRTGTGLRSFVPSWWGSAAEKTTGILPSSDVMFVDPLQALELGALRLRLRALGFSEQEVNRVLESARFQLFERVPDSKLAKQVYEVGERVLRIGAELTAQSEGRKNRVEDEVKFVAEIQRRTQNLDNFLKDYARWIRAGESFNINNMYNDVSDGIKTTYWMQDMLGLGRNQTPLYFGSVASNESILQLRRELLDLSVKIMKTPRLDWMTGERQIKSIDDLITAGDLERMSERDAKKEPYFEMP